jgi:hypothetical protein
MASFSLNSIFGNPKQVSSTDESSKIKVDSPLDYIYKVHPENWYTAKPYGFKYTSRDGKSTQVMFLPISPSNLNISTPFATNVIPTLYGTVEEHSDIRYYDIVIEGTTGIAPEYIEPGSVQSESSTGRSTVTPASALINANGFFSKTISIINSISNKATDLVNGSETNSTGVRVDQTGYLAFHNLYRFLLRYKKEVSGASGEIQLREKHPLIFFNYKDNNQYKVAIRNFTLRRSAENPMLYNYSIVMRGYSMTTANGEYDSKSAEEVLKDLGLNGIDSSNLLGKIKGTANKVRGILGPLGAGINILGR